MGKKLYVGNLPFSATEQVLADTFSQSGTVESVRIIVDRDSRKSKGFGFVEMSSDEEAANAISKFHGADYDGRQLTVNEARPVAPRSTMRPSYAGSGSPRNAGRGGFAAGSRKGR